MYDSTDPSAIPADALLVAGYCDGRYAWPPAAWARFTRAVKVRIACFASTNDGQVLDIETGCAAPAEAPGWVQRRRTAGADPTVYVNRANFAAVRALFQRGRVAEPHYWLATLDGTQPWAPGIVAIQTTDAAHSGGRYDLSAVQDHWPGVDQAGATMPVVLILRDPVSGAQYLIGAAGKRHIGGPESAALIRAGATVLDMEAAELAQIPYAAGT